MTTACRDLSREQGKPVPRSRRRLHAGSGPGSRLRRRQKGPFSGHIWDTIWRSDRHDRAVEMRNVDAIRELLITEPVEEKLAGRGISSEEAQQLIDNRYAIVANRGRRRRSQRKLDARRLVVGQTNGGRHLTSWLSKQWTRPLGLQSPVGKQPRPSVECLAIDNQRSLDRPGSAAW